MKILSYKIKKIIINKTSKKQKLFLLLEKRNLKFARNRFMKIPVFQIQKIFS